MACIVDMSDTRWASLREASRRFLKEEGVILEVPAEDKTAALHLVQSIADYIPSRLALPNIIQHDSKFQTVQGLFQLGGPEPNVETCWIPGEVWNDFLESCLDLLEAGYPGCVGCGGPGAEGPWNEESRRRSFLV